MFGSGSGGGSGEAVVLGLALGFILLIGLVVLAIQVVICLLLYGCLERIPREFRRQESGMVWLLMIPCFSIIWNFFVYPRIADSYQAYFASVNRQDVGDCGRSVGLAYCICVACSLIPYLGTITGLAALVLLIIFIIKALELKRQIPEQ